MTARARRAPGHGGPASDGAAVGPPGRAGEAPLVVPAPDWRWRAVLAVLFALLACIVAAALVALALLVSVGGVADRVMRQDVAFEDQVEDVHVGVHDLRAKHIVLAIAGPSRAGIAELAGSVAALRTEIDELEAVGASHGELATPDDLRAMLAAYQARTVDALPSVGSDLGAFDRALDDGLVVIGDLERETASLNALGKQRAAVGLDQLRRETGNATLVLILVVAGAVAGGVALTAFAVWALRELRLLAAAERRSAASARRLLDARTALIAEASHELRTPLTILRGNAELGARLPPAGDAHIQVLGEIAAEATRMGRIVEDLLFLARHDAGTAPLEREEVELEALAAEIGARCEVLARQRGAALTVRTGAAGRAWLDPGRIAQAALILVDNAVAYAATGGPVELCIERDGDAIVIEVADRGPGIPPDTLPHVFDRFRRGGPPGPSGGAGLGLAIARAIAEGHGGEATVRSSPAGTRAAIRIPLVSPPARPA